jgi:thioredoxin reductase (NADPH)
MAIHPLIIIGNGPAGYTAAIYAARAGLAPVVYSGNEPGGLLMQAAKIENFPGFTEPIGGPELMESLQQQAEHFGAQTEYDTVTAVHFAPNANELILASGASVSAKAVIIATGTRHRSLGLAREKELLGHGVSYCATCDAAFFKERVVAVVGGNDRALEEALVLANSARVVHLLHRRAELSATMLLQQRIHEAGNIVVHLNTIPTELLGDVQLSSIKLRDTISGASSVLECAGIFAAIGVQPNTEFLEGSGIALNEIGYIIHDDAMSTATNLPGVFAAGDCAEPRYHQAVIAAGAGARAAMDALSYLHQ